MDATATITDASERSGLLAAADRMRLDRGEASAERRPGSRSRWRARTALRAGG